MLYLLSKIILVVLDKLLDKSLYEDFKDRLFSPLFNTKIGEYSRAIKRYTDVPHDNGLFLRICTHNA